MAEELPIIPELNTTPEPLSDPALDGPVQLSVDQDEGIDDQPQLFDEETVSTENVEPVPMTDVQRPEEPIEVAGLVDDFILPVAKRIKAEADKGRVVGGSKGIDEPVEKVGDFFVIREATDEEVTSFNNIIGTTEGNPPSVAINYDRHIGTESELATFDQISQVMKEYIDKQKRGSVTFLETIKAAERKLGGGVIDAVRGETGTTARLREGNIDGVLDLLFKRNIGQPINAEDLIAGRLALDVINRDVTRLSEIVLSGAATDAQKVKFRQAMSLEGAAMASLLGGRAEAARTTAAGRIISDVSQSRADEITRMLTEGGDNTVEWLAERYAILPTQEAKAQFSRGILGKAADVWQTIFLNAWLSGLSTQTVNIAGNAGMAVLQLLERGGAEIIGGTRRALTGSTRGVQRGEALTMLHGLVVGTPNAFRLLVKSFIEDTPQSGGLTTKLDVRTRNPITGENLASESVRNFGIGPVANVGRAIDGLGFIFSLPGRTLMSVDEFFKAWNGNAQLYAITLRRMKQNIADGMTPAKAEIRRDVELRDPPTEVVEAVRDFADVSTFTNDLEGALGNLQTTFSHPLAKVAVPFFKTPTNILSQVAQRAGPLAALSPRFWKNATSADAATRDLAMSRLAIGSTIMGSFAMYAGGETFDDQGNVIDDVIITGSGPTARGSQDAFRRQNLSPYSVCSKQDGGSYDCISFARFDPVSGLLAIAADFKEYSRYSNDPAELETLATAAALAAENYVDQLPMLQGMTQIVSLFGRKDSDGLFLPNLLDKLAEMTATTVLQPGMAIMTTGTNYSSFIASIERMQDPTAKDTTPDPNLPLVVRGFYAALLKAKARNPFFSDDVPDRLTLFAEKVNQGNGRAYELFSPIRIREAKFNKLDSEIQRLNFFVGGRLTMNSFKKVNGVKLTTTQKNILIEETNDIEINGALMKEAMQDLIVSDRYIDQLSNEEKVQELGEIITTYRGNAGSVPSGGIKALLEQDIELEDQVNFNDLPASEQRKLKSEGLAP